MKLVVRSVIVIAILCICTLKGFGQQARETFGKNRIQYRQFNWQYLSGENFDIYYYDNQKEIAHDALEYLEQEFDRITDLIDYPPYFKTKVFLYQSLADLRQSNMGLNHTYYNVGGETEFIKPYVEVANPGTIEEFKEELLLQISTLMVNEMMFGGNLKDIFQSSLLMNLPDWFIDGASLYVAKGWNAEMDDYIRQFMNSKKSKKISKLKGDEAALAGQSVWNFISEKYGKSSVSNILNYTRVTRDEEKSVQITLGVSFRQLMADWQKYYTNMSKSVNEAYVSTSDSTRFSGYQNKTTVYSTVKISPDGNYIAYAKNDRGHYTVKVRSLKNGRERTIITGGTKVIKQRVDYSLPLLSWSNDNTLGIVAVKQGKYIFWLYDLNSKSKIPRELDKFNNVHSLNFSKNGRLVILSADFDGKNDLFLLSTKRDRLRRLTNDSYDDLDPSFIPNTNKIVFSSNRTSDSLRTKQKPDFERLSKNYNLFVFDLDSAGTELTRVTNTVSKDFSPLAVDGNTFYYLSDQRGIVNLFKFNTATGIYTQVTNYASSVTQYDLNFATNTLALVSSHKMEQNIFLIPYFNLNQSVFTPATRRKELQQARSMYDRKSKEENTNMSTKDLLNERLKKKNQLKNDTTNILRDSLRNNPNIPLATDTLKKEKESKTLIDVVNTDNYQFEEEPVKQTQPNNSFVTRYMKVRDKSRIKGPFPYQSKFGANNLVTSVVFDPLRGLGVLLETQMNDMLENYRFYGGIMSTVDLRSGDTYAEFQYLPRLIDLNVRFDRKTITWQPPASPIADTVDYQYRYSLNKLEVGASLPLTDRLRFTLKPFAAFTRSVDQTYREGQAGSPPNTTYPNFYRDPINRFYAGIKSELVYDNSVSTGLNLIEGTRGKITFIHYESLENKNLSFDQASIELRHYQRIFKEVTFAVRGFGGKFFGNSPKTYLLGGMDNWIFNSTVASGITSTGEANPIGVQSSNEDLLFVEYVTSLRGFDYATLFGNNALLFNAELRVPVASMFTNTHITSTFFRNLQLVAFYDIGTSWSGKPPFSSENSVSNQIIKDPVFKATIKNYLNPWLQSYGAGMRTVLFGYYVKFDLAWPVQNYEVLKPRPFLTLGFDF